MLLLSSYTDSGALEWDELMVQELDRSKDNDDQEKQALKGSSEAEAVRAEDIWPASRQEASSQLSILSRLLIQNKDQGSLNLPKLLLLSDTGEPVERRADTQDNLKAAEALREQVNLNGSRLLLNKDNSIASLIRKDGSVVEIKYDKSGQQTEIIDCNKDGKSRTVWTQNAKQMWESNTQIKDGNGNWVSDGKQAREYRDISITQQGLTVSRDLVGFMTVTAADGNRLADGARYTFDEKGRIDSISYMPGENRNLRFHYDANDKIDRVEFRDADGKLQQTKTRTADGEWRVTNANGTTGGVWKGDIELAPDAKFKQRDEKDRAADQWQVIAPFETYTEKISPDGKYINRVYSDKSVDLERTEDGEERITKFTRGTESREFRYDADGKVSELIEKTTRGTESLKTDGMKVQIWPSGDVIVKKPDGAAIFKKYNFGSQEWDGDGNLLKVVTPEGKSRSFDFDIVNNQKQLVRITDISVDKTGKQESEVWTPRRNADGSIISGQFVKTGAGGKEEVVGDLKLKSNGDFSYKTSDGRERTSRIGSDQSREGGFSSTVDDARIRLKAALDGELDSGRKLRLEKLMDEMEKRAKDAIERQTIAGNDQSRTSQKWETKLARTYDYLAEMMEQNPSTAVYDRATRARLVENFIWIAADTTRGAQDVGNCWQMSGRNLTGMQNNPDAMARILKDVSLTGSFTALHGGIKAKTSLDRRRGDLNAARKFTIPQNLLKLDRVNAGWSLDKPDDSYWQGGIGTMPSTPVGYILDNVIGYMGGRKSHSALDGGLWESFASPSSRTREGWYYGINELMYMATGERTNKPIRISSNSVGEGDIRNLTDKRLQKQLLEHGGALLVGPGHMFAVKLVKSSGEWQIVTDNQWGKGGDQVIGKVTDLRNWTVQRTRTRYKSSSVV